MKRIKLAYKLSVFAMLISCFSVSFSYTFKVTNVSVHSISGLNLVNNNNETLCTSVDIPPFNNKGTPTTVPLDCSKTAGSWAAFKVQYKDKAGYAYCTMTPILLNDPALTSTITICVYDNNFCTYSRPNKQCNTTLLQAK